MSISFHRSSLSFPALGRRLTAVHVIKQTNQIKGLHTIIRDVTTNREDFVSITHSPFFRFPLSLLA